MVSRGVFAFLLMLIIGGGRVFAATPPCFDVDCIRDIPYQTVERTQLLLDLYRPLGATGDIPVVLAIHGGHMMQGAREEMRPLAMLLTQHGYAVIAMQYRLAPDYVFPTQLADAHAAARWTREHAAEYHLDLSRCAALGVSAGAQVAALLAMCPQNDGLQFAGVITIAGPMDLTTPPPNSQARIALKLYLGGELQKHTNVYAAASPITHIAPACPPFLIIHGTRDPLVPFNQAERMTAALQTAKVPVTLFPVKGMGHPVPTITAEQQAQISGTACKFLDELRLARKR